MSIAYQGCNYDGFHVSLNQLEFKENIDLILQLNIKINVVHIIITAPIKYVFKLNAYNSINFSYPSTCYPDYLVGAF